MNKQNVYDELNKYKNSNSGQPWKAILEGHPVYLPNFGWLEILTSDRKYDTDSWGNDRANGSVVRFKVEGYSQIWEVEAFWDSWDSYSSFSLYEIQEVTRTVTEYVRVP